MLVTNTSMKSFLRNTLTDPGMECKGGQVSTAQLLCFLSCNPEATLADLKMVRKGTANF